MFRGIIAYKCIEVIMLMIMILTVAYPDYILLRTYCGEYLRFTPKFSTHKEKVPKTKKGKEGVR